MRGFKVAAVAVGVAVCIPVAASASSHGGARAESSAAKGAVFGGRTGQGWPVMIELTKNRKRVVQAVIGLRLTCTSGTFVNLPDRYVNMTVNRRRKFSASFGPDTQRNDDGTTTDFQGSISGRLNRARSKVSGTWNFKLTEFDAADAVTDTCDSGTVRWTAKQ